MASTRAGAARRGPAVVAAAVVADWAPVLVAVLPVLCLWVIDVVAMRGIRVPASDIAVLEITTRNVGRGQQFLGAYSRYGWSHPGPALFTWYFPFYELAGRQLGGLVVGAATCNLACVAVIARTVQRAAGRTAAWWSALALVVVAGIIGFDHLHNPWNTELVILPVAALGVVGAATVAGRRWALPATAFLASWVAQTHLGAVAVAAALSVVVVALVAWRHRHGLRRWGAAGVVAVAVVAAMWAPVAYQEITREPGNLTSIREFFDRDAEPGPTVGDATDALTVAVVGRQDDFVEDRAIPLAWRLAAAALLAVVGLGLASGLARRRAARDDEARAFVAAAATLTLVGLAVAVVSVRNVRGPVYGYLLSFATGLGYLAWVTAAVVAGRTWRRLAATPALGSPARAGRAPARARVLGRFAAGAVVVGSVASTAGAVATGPWNRNPDFPERRSEFHHTLRVDNDQARSVVDAVVRSGRVRRGQRVEVVWPTGWDIGAGVVNQLERVGIRATVPADLEFVFGETLTSDGSETARIVMVPIPAAGAPAPAPPLPPPPDPRDRIGDGIAYEVYVVPLGP